MEFGVGWQFKPPLQEDPLLDHLFLADTRGIEDEVRTPMHSIVEGNFGLKE